MVLASSAGDTLTQDARPESSRHTFMNSLIVEDNERARRLIKCLIAGYADEIREAVSGEEAMTACQSRRANCVLADWDLRDIKLPFRTAK